MSSNNHRATGWRQRLHGLWLPLLALPLLMAGWAGYATYVADNGIPVATDDGWSGEVLEQIHTGLIEASPLGVANACGLGASSCFKCHNGKRAAAPAEKAWHTQHAEVNHSCVGCHNGNQRLMVERMAHKDLIADPRPKAGETCANCHEGGSADELLKQYQGE